MTDFTELLGIENITLEVGCDTALEAVVIRVPALRDGGCIMLSPALAADLASLIIGTAMRLRQRQIAGGEE